MTAKQVQFRRGSASDHTTFTGAVGEITVDTTDNRAVVHDGSTAGGHPLALEAELADYLPTSYLDTDNTLAADSDTKIASQKATKAYALPASYLDTDDTLAADSDTKVASQKATKAYVDAAAAAVVNISGNAATATALETARTIEGVSFDGSADITVIAEGTHAASSKATPVDADEVPLVDSAASNILKKLTWANLKSTLFSSPTLVTPALGTPASGTLTNCTSLPISGLTASTSTALGVGSIELGHASDTTLSRSSAGVLAVEGVTVALNSTAATHTAGTIELGAASDTTISRTGAGDIAVEGNAIYRAGGTDVPVADGGTGLSSTTAYAVLCGGTTSTAALQSIAGVGTSGQVLTSNGAGALPTFQAAAGGSAAAQSDMETATDTALFVTPGRQHYHPAHVKAQYNALVTPTAISGAASSWNTTTEVCTWNAAHGLTTGDTFIPVTNQPGGVTNLSPYYVNVASTTTFTLHTTLADAIAGTNAVNITSSTLTTARKLVYSNVTTYGMSSVSPFTGVAAGVDIGFVFNIGTALSSNKCQTFVSWRSIVNGSSVTSTYDMPNPVPTSISSKVITIANTSLTNPGAAKTLGTWSSQGTTAFDICFLLWGDF